MNKQFNTFDEIGKRLQAMLNGIVVSSTTEELWQKFFSKNEWDENYLALIKEELQKRIAGNKN